jgi:hypothetical protein
VWYGHLVVEDLGLARLSGRDQVLVKHAEDIVANLGKLTLDLLAVLLDEGDLGGVALRLLLLLDRRNNAPRRAASANDVLVGNRQQVPLLNGQVTVLGRNNLHVLNHLCGQSRVSVFARRCARGWGAELGSGYMPS